MHGTRQGAFVPGGAAETYNDNGMEGLRLTQLRARRRLSLILNVGYAATRCMTPLL
jgi:hypothetical protein